MGLCQINGQMDESGDLCWEQWVMIVEELGMGAVDILQK